MLSGGKKWGTPVCRRGISRDWLMCQASEWCAAVDAWTMGYQNERRFCCGVTGHAKLERRQLPTQRPPPSRTQ